MSKKILIIDDEPEMVELIKLRLQANNLEVITASEGEEGLDKMIKDKPDLVILDIMMPNMDGYSFLRETRRDPFIAKIPIIVLTAKPDMKDLFGLEGIKDYIIKPFEADELMQKIKERLKL